MESLGLARSPETDDGSAKWLEKHLDTIEDRILNEARSLAKSEGRAELEPKDIAVAAMHYAPGNRFPDVNLSDTPFLQRISASISGITMMSAALAIMFGLIGMFGADAAKQSAYDIAKIFAGAVVGSTGASAVANTRKS